MDRFVSEEFRAKLNQLQFRIQTILDFGAWTLGALVSFPTLAFSLQPLEFLWRIPFTARTNAPASAGVPIVMRKYSFTSG